MEEVPELGICGAVAGDEHCSLVGVEAGQDGDFVVGPGVVVPGVDGGEGDYAPRTVDDGLEGPADGGIVGLEDGFGSALDGGCVEGAEFAEELVFGDGAEAEMGDEGFKLLLVEGVGWGIEYSRGGCAGF